MKTPLSGSVWKVCAVCQCPHAATENINLSLFVLGESVSVEPEVCARHRSRHPVGVMWQPQHSDSHPELEGRGRADSVQSPAAAVEAGRGGAGSHPRPTRRDSRSATTQLQQHKGVWCMFFYIEIQLNSLFSVVSVIQSSLYHHRSSEDTQMRELFLKYHFTCFSNSITHRRLTHLSLIFQTKCKKVFNAYNNEIETKHIQ